MTIIRPKFVALDSSHLGAIARDRASSDPSRQQRAALFAEQFDGSGSILVLKHRDEVIVADRVAFIQSLPMTATIASLTDDTLPGSIIDLHAHETAAAFRMPSSDAVAVRNKNRTVAVSLWLRKMGYQAVSGSMELRPA